MATWLRSLSTRNYFSRQFNLAYLIIATPATKSFAIFAPTLVLAVLPGPLLSLFLYAIVGLLAFRTEDINPVLWIVGKAIMTLGGSYLPVALFPGFMYKISLWSPFGASQFVIIPFTKLGPQSG